MNETLVALAILGPIALLAWLTHRAWSAASAAASSAERAKPSPRPHRGT